MKPRLTKILFALLWIPVFALAQSDVDRSDIDIIIEDAADQEIHVPDDLTMRVRILAMKPFEPTHLRYKYGGWGSPGERVYGYFWKPAKPAAAEPKKPSLDDLLDGDEAKPKTPDTLKDAEPVPRKIADKPPLFELNEWSEHTQLAEFLPGGATNPRYLQVFCGTGGEIGEGRVPGGGRNWQGAETGLKIEFEFHYGGELLKEFVVEGPDGPIAPIVIPFGELTDGTKPNDPAFVDNLVPLLEFVTRMADEVTANDWADGPKPEKLAMVTNLGGYGPTNRLGVRHSDKRIVEQEVRILRAMGMNGFQGGPSFLLQQAMRGEGLGAAMNRGDHGGAHGYPVPRWEDGRGIEHAGCPCSPIVGEAEREAVAGAAEDMKAHSGFFMVKGTTVDEIGAVIDRSKEGKAHLSVCPHCKRGFHAYLEEQALTPADFGDADWSTIAPLMLWNNDPDSPTPWLENRRDAMLAYWTRRFNCHSSASMFDELRHAARAENAKKRATLEAGDTESEVARQPWHYPGAMRGNSFLMKGHSLDFFNFYRVADNAFIYETSNRDARVWSWDSYLCDVGRVVTAHPDMAQELFGVYVKPHRGAGFQRGLSAVSRGTRYINWYTYGPPYAKGDCWGQKPEIVDAVGRANRLIAEAEHVLYGGEWAEPARIAVVKPRASEIWMHLTRHAPAWTASWENAKWVYIALTHAHLPVDPIDQIMIREDDLSGYDVIYVNGPNLERAAAKRLAEWVEAGGTLVTMGYGLARDEYNEPLDFMQPVLGLTERPEPEMWHTTKLYGATSLHRYDDESRIAEPASPAAAEVEGTGIVDGEFALTVGREVLQPVPSAEVLANYGDGGAAMIRHRCGKGQVYVGGFFAGLEYVVPLMHDRFHMRRDFDATRRRFASAPAEEHVQPVVDVSEPTVEAILIRHPETGKQAVTLMNWAYGVTAVRKIRSERGESERFVRSHLPAENVHVSIRAEGEVSKIRALALGEDLDFERREQTIELSLPRIDEGEILLLE